MLPIFIGWYLGIVLGVLLMEQRRRKQLTIHNEIIAKHKEMFLKLNDTIDLLQKKAETK